MRRASNHRCVKPKQQTAQSCHNRASQNIRIEFHVDFLSFFPVRWILASSSTVHLPDLHLTKAVYAPDCMGFPAVSGAISSASTQSARPVRSCYCFAAKSSATLPPPPPAISSNIVLFDIVTPGGNALTITEYPYGTSRVSAHDTPVPVLDTLGKGIPVSITRPGGGLPSFYAAR